MVTTALLWASLPCGAAAAQTPAVTGGCQRDLVAKVALGDDAGFLSIAASIASHPVRLMLDTGSDAGLITPQAARALPLRVDQNAQIRLQGTGGDSTARAVADVAGLAIGGVAFADVAMPVGALPAAPELEPPVVGLIGGDVLSRFDLDLDLPHGSLSFWRIRAGSLACAPPPVWKGAFRTVKLTAHGVRLSLTAVLDGHPISALLDTGARSRIVSLRAALRVGVSADVLATEPGGITSGVDMREQLYHWHRFRRLAIGGGVETSPVLTVAPLQGGFDMLLGTDWLQTREVWISYATKQMFVR